MNSNLDVFLESTKPPENKPWMDNVVFVFINGIPADCYKYCSNSDKEIKEGDDNIKREHLAGFVRERLQILAEREYKLWINGRMPYITPRELQLWRLRQFVQYIWYWNLPDDNDLAMIFNETKRKASNLINDFIARFRKTLLFPVALLRLYRILTDDPDKKNVPHKNWGNAVGNVYSVINRRYLDDCNMLIHELRIRVSPGKPLLDSYFYHRDILQIWVDSSVIDILVNDKPVVDDIFNTYPQPEQEHE